MEQLSNLANAGLAGVSIALIIALVIIVRQVLRLIGNHMNHLTESNTRLAEKIEQLMNHIASQIGKR